MSRKRCPTYTTIAAAALLYITTHPLLALADDTGPRLPDEPGYDMVSAQIPAGQAPTASVALARLSIMLYRAKARTETRLCGGNWTPRGEAHTRTGPLPLLDSEGKQHSWHYVSLREPHALACPNVSRAEFFLEMSRHLPGWVVVRPAGQLTAFRQGTVYTVPAGAIAGR